MVKGRKWLVRGVQLLLLFVLGYYLIYRNLYLNWQKLDTSQWELRWWPLALSTLGLALTFALNSQIWRLVVWRMSRVNVRPYRAIYIWFIANLGRYLPGKMWQIAGMAMLARGEGVPAMDAAAASVLNHVILLLAGAALGLAMLPSAAAGPYAELFRWAWLGLPLVLVLLWPPVLNRVLARAAKMTGRPFAGKLRTGDILLFFLVNLAVWLVYGLCFHYFILAVIPEAPLRVTESVGVYAIGYIIGFLAIFAPGGLVVRELMFTQLLSGSLGQAPATAVALLSRVWFTLAELLPVLTVLALSGLPGKAIRKAPEEKGDGES